MNPQPDRSDLRKVLAETLRTEAGPIRATQPATHTAHPSPLAPKRFNNHPRSNGKMAMRGSAPSAHAKSRITKNAKFTPIKKRTPSVLIPPVAPGNIRIIPLGGVEEIGKNMTAIETADDIIVIDAGMQFETEATPGVDYIIPNTTYLEERKDKIRALIVTHGHLDHIGGISLVANRIGNPPIYSRYLTTLLIQKRQSEYPGLPALNINVVEKTDKIQLGNMHIRFFGVTHTFPDAMGVIVDTPYGIIVNPGDYKLDQVDGIPTVDEDKEYSMFDKEKVLMLLTDSTNIENEGFALPEIKVHEGLEKIIARATGRIIVAAFASHISRLTKIVQIAEGMGKKVALDGRSMKTNLEISIQANIFSPKKDTLIPIEDIDKYPPNKILILMTGGQGEEFASLARASRKAHNKFALKKGDTIILSASVVPGNEKDVEKMRDGLARQGVKVISYRTAGEDFVHATGHGNKEDVKWLHRKMRPTFFMPIHGNHYRLTVHKELAMELGMSEENIAVPDNGSLVEIQDHGTKLVILKEKAPAAPMVVDGLSVSDEQGVVFRDRKMLAEDGIFIVISALDATGKLKKSPDLISRGFVYLKENQELLYSARNLVKKTIEDYTAHNKAPLNMDNLKEIVAETVTKFLFQKTAKRPLVIPVILSI